MIFRHLLNMRSHPTWVRGLKPCATPSCQRVLASHPTWVRGLKQQAAKKEFDGLLSHPTWVRGLKLKSANGGALDVCRTLRGCVD